MTIAEKRKFVTGFCADVEGCDVCPCYAVGNCRNRAILNLDDDNALDAMIAAIKGESFVMVDSPPHYTSTSIECIDAMIETQGNPAVISFCVCNAFKYLWRHRWKNQEEDIRKANWYLNKAVELMDKE